MSLESTEVTVLVERAVSASASVSASAFASDSATVSPVVLLLSSTDEFGVDAGGADCIWDCDGGVVPSVSKAVVWICGVLEVLDCGSNFAVAVEGMEVVDGDMGSLVGAGEGGACERKTRFAVRGEGEAGSSDGATG